MSTQRQGMLIPALVGGAVAGVLTAVPFVSCFCCLWIIGGGMLAAYLLAKNSTSSLTSGDGAIVGIFSGIVAAVAEAFISLPFQSFNEEFARKFMDQFSQFAEDMPSGWERWLEGSSFGNSPAWFLLGLVISAVIFAAFGALGGTLGASLFGKKKLPPSGVMHETPQDSGDRQP